MKKTLLFLSLSLTLFAHSQVPIIYGGEKNKFDSISLTQTKLVPIKIQNLNNYPQKYLISVNSKNIGETPFLSKNEIKEIKVPVKIKKANKLEVHRVCTTSIPNNKKEMFNTKVCTKAFLYWSK